MPADVRAANLPPVSRGASRPVRVLRWLGPGVVFILIPKCPVCFAAYLALFTGVAVSLTVAETLRVGLLGCCGVSVAWLLFARWRAAHRAGSAARGPRDRP